MALSTVGILNNSKSKLAKNIIPVMAIVAVGGVAYVGYKFLSKDQAPKLSTYPNVPKSTLTDVQATAIADRLYAAMSGTGSSNKPVLAALQGLTANDFIRVYDAFGKRQYSLFWGNIGDPVTSSNHHLITWLTNELSDSEIKEMQKIIPNLLSL